MMIRVKIQPNASKDEISGLGEDGILRVRVAAPPSDGLANRRLVRYISKKLGLRPSAVSIFSGHKGRHKVLEISGAGSDVLSLLKGE